MSADRSSLDVAPAADGADSPRPLEPEVSLTTAVAGVWVGQRMGHSSCEVQQAMGGHSSSQLQQQGRPPLTGLMCLRTLRGRNLPPLWPDLLQL